MLPKVICPVELLGLIAFSKLVLPGQMFNSLLPLRRHWKFFPTITAYFTSRRMLRGSVERCRIIAWECRARPRVFPQMEWILVPFCFVFILKPIVAILATVLLLHFMQSTHLSEHTKIQSSEIRRTASPFGCQIFSAFSGSIHTCIHLFSGLNGALKRHPLSLCRQVPRTPLEFVCVYYC